MAKPPAALSASPVAKPPAARSAAVPPVKKKPAAATPPAVDGAIEWSNSYDADLQKAFRRRRGARKADPGEDNVEIRVPDGAQSTDPMEAVWADGSTWQVPQTTVATWNPPTGRPTRPPPQPQADGQAPAAAGAAISSGHPSPGAGDTLATTKYVWTHPVDGKQVRVFARYNQPKGKKKDRLICLQHQTHPQVVMVNIDLFKQDPSDTDEMTEIRAWAWMVPIAKKYVRQAIDRYGCIEEKNKLLPGQTGVPKARKRPAAADADASAPQTAAAAAAPSAVGPAALAQVQPAPVAASPQTVDKTAIDVHEPETEKPKAEPDAEVYPETPKQNNHKKEKKTDNTVCYRTISPPPASSHDSD